MADENVHEVGENEESISIRHRKERKEFQAKIQSMKNRVPKGDKKTKKAVLEEVAQLEMQLDERQNKELQNCRLLFDNPHGVKMPDFGPITDQLGQLSVGDSENGKMQKASRAQKRRDKKELKEKDREKSIAQQEIANQFGPRNIESTKLKSILREKNLRLYEVPSDGNCLYAAIKHQLNEQNIQAGIEELRRSTAKYMLGHPNDFMPFLCNPSTGDPLSTIEYGNYCHEVATSSEAWGSQTELQALAQAFRCTIEVLQAEGPVIRVGEEFSGATVVLTYHRHTYGLGEHYNSVTRCPPGSENPDSP